MIMTNREIICTLWVCQCCMLAHANGECCADDTHGGDSVEPWANLADGEHVTMGQIRGEHSAYCTGDDCDCDTDTYSTSQCGGCGSYLHGERHAFTLWRRTGVSLTKTA